MITEIVVYVKQGKELIPTDYYHKMHGFVCNLVGNEHYGKITNNYTYSNFHNALYKKGGIYFKNGKSFFTIRLNEDSANVLEHFLKNYQKFSEKEIFDGITLDGFSFNRESVFNKSVFRTMYQSPILISFSNKEQKKQMYLNDMELKWCENYLRRSVLKKAYAQGITLDKDLSIKIKNQKKPRIIKYNGFYNTGRIFDFEINCDEKTKEFIMLHGLGASCGCGFGMIY